LRTRWVAGGSTLAVLLLVTLSLGQGRRQAKPRVTKPAPAMSIDAGAPEALSPETDPSPGAANSNGAPDAASAAAPLVVRSEGTDGGPRPSPLNPQPNEFPDGGGAPAGPDYDRLLGEIAALRARIAAVSDTLFQARIAVLVQAEGGHAKVEKLSVALDDGNVYTAAPNFRADDMTSIYERAVAPGKHAVTVDIERKDDRDETFRTTQRSRVVVDVPESQRLEVAIRIDDDSNMGGNFKNDRSGRYDLRVRFKANAAPVKR
jgi:hypothetical protein